jgi:hypothetical protein
VPLVDEIELILADVLRAKAIWGGPKVLGKLGDTAEIGGNSLRRIVPQLQIFQHPLA